MGNILWRSNVLHTRKVQGNFHVKPYTCADVTNNYVTPLYMGHTLDLRILKFKIIFGFWSLLLLAQQSIQYLIFMKCFFSRKLHYAFAINRWSHFELADIKVISGRHRNIPTIERNFRFLVIPWFTVPDLLSPKMSVNFHDQFGNFPLNGNLGLIISGRFDRLDIKFSNKSVELHMDVD